MLPSSLWLAFPPRNNSVLSRMGQGMITCFVVCLPPPESTFTIKILIRESYPVAIVVSLLVNARLRSSFGRISISLGVHWFLEFTRCFHLLPHATGLNSYGLGTNLTSKAIVATRDCQHSLRRNAACILLTVSTAASEKVSKLYA